MNCQDFESNLDGLARGALMDARALEVALSHERTCARCSARLAHERALTSGLRALADATKDACAPARVETALLVALRARVASNAEREVSVVASEGAPAASGVGGMLPESKNVRQLAASENVRHLSWVKTFAVAALAAAAAVALFMLMPAGLNLFTPKTNGDVAKNRDTGRKPDNTTRTAGETATTSVQLKDAAVQPSGAHDGQADASDGQGLPSASIADGGEATHGVPARHPLRAIRTTPANSITSGGVAHTASATVASASGDSEITTDFIPLMQGARLSQGDGVHMVRVELPRSALARFGLPVNAEQPGGRVKADVLLGEDGMARAIRFVR